MKEETATKLENIRVNSPADLGVNMVQAPFVHPAGEKVVRESDIKPDILVQELLADPGSAGMTGAMAIHVLTFFLQKCKSIEVDSMQMLMQSQGAASGSCGKQVQASGQAPVIVHVPDGDGEEMSEVELTGDEREASVANGTGTAKRMKRSTKKSLVVLKAAKDTAKDNAAKVK